MQEHFVCQYCFLSKQLFYLIIYILYAHAARKLAAAMKQSGLNKPLCMLETYGTQAGLNMH